MAVSARVYGEIAARLQAAGYDQAFHEQDGDAAPLLDMHGIALERATATVGAVEGLSGDEPQRIELSSLLSSRTKSGLVELSVGHETVQMDIPKARHVLALLSGAIEAAISDELIFRFLHEKMGVSVERAGAALLDFRELRQGSRGTVNPS
jgi:hypothetical protein